MNIIKKLSSLWNMASTMDILEALYINSQSKSGTSVTWQTALQYSTSLACARVIGEALAQNPFKLMQLKDGKREPARDNPLFEVLSLKPNDYMTSFELRENIGIVTAMTGNWFAFINRTKDGIQELLPWEPGQVKIIRDKWMVGYVLTTKDGEQVPVPPQNIWHVKGPTWNTYLGLDGVKLARESIGLGIATEEHGSLLFRNGAQSSGLLSTDQLINKEKAAQLKESWQEDNAHGNRFKTAVLWSGMKWQSMAATNDQSQFLQTRAFQVEEVCRAFRVLPIMVGHSDKAATYASSEQMFKAHSMYTLTPWTERTEQSADVNLLTKQQRKDGMYTKFFINGLLRGVAKDRVAYYKGMSEIHAMTPNEIRELEDMNPYEGGDEFPILQGQSAGNDNTDDTAGGKDE